jgi:hypothetical protein
MALSVGGWGWGSRRCLSLQLPVSMGSMYALCPWCILYIQVDSDHACTECTKSTMRIRGTYVLYLPKGC